jgi:hypothetical protein
LQVREVRIERDGGRATLRADVRSDARADADFPLEIEWSGLDEETDLRAGDALLAFLLVPAMASGEVLDLARLSVSRKLLETSDRIQEIYREWSEGLSRVVVKAGSEVREPDGEGSALFFSAGVDSWFSLLTASEAGSRPTHLLFLVGFDMEARHRQRVAQAMQAAREAARRYGAALVVCRSNVRELSDRLAQWSLYHGGYLAGVALALGGVLESCYISASNSPDSIRHWGSHPELDALWSTESLRFAQAGFETNRFEKIARIAADDLALRTLRVCWQPVDEYNCGRCPKCALTMTALHLIGKLEDASTFPERIDLDALAAVDAGRRGERRTSIGAMIPAALERGEHDLARALRRARRSRYLRPRNYLAAAGRRLSGEHGRRARLKF